MQREARANGPHVHYLSPVVERTASCGGKGRVVAKGVFQQAAGELALRGTQREYR